MNIFNKRWPKYSYREKRNKDDKNLIEARLNGPIEEVLARKTTPGGQVIEHQMNKNMSPKFKENYDKVNWKNDDSKEGVKIKNKVKYIYL